MLDPNDPRAQFHIKRMVDEEVSDEGASEPPHHYGPTCKGGFWPSFIKALIIGLLIGVILAILAKN